MILIFFSSYFELNGHGPLIIFYKINLWIFVFEKKNMIGAVIVFCLVGFVENLIWWWFELDLANTQKRCINIRSVGDLG